MDGEVSKQIDALGGTQLRAAVRRRGKDKNPGREQKLYPAKHWADKPVPTAQSSPEANAPMASGMPAT